MKHRAALGAAAAVLLGAVALAACLWHRMAAHTGDPVRTAVWRSYGGVWSAPGGTIENSSGERGAANVLLENGKDQAFDADIVIAEQGGEAGLALRTSGEEIGAGAFHGYLALLRTTEGTLEFGRSDFGWHPLARVAFSNGFDATQGIHLRVVAVGCAFGVEATLRDGEHQALAVEDPQCMEEGHAMLRSSLSSTSWRNLSLRPATQGDLDAVRRLATASRPLPVAEADAGGPTDRMEASLQAEAKKRALQAGVEPILNFLMQPGRHPHVTLQGAIISMPPLVAIQDETNALIIPHVDPRTPIKLGDIVIAQGTVISERYRSRLEDAKLRVLWSDLPMPPLLVTAAQLTGGTYRGRSIELQGTLVSSIRHGSEQAVVLRDGDLLFLAIGTPDLQADFSHFEAGSRLRVRGLATSLSEFTQGTYPFAVLVTKADIVNAPPWWTAKHIVWLALVCTLLVYAIQAIVYRAQQWHLESVMKEREQLAFEMHDTLAQSFTGIAYQLNAATLERRGEDQVRSHIHHALAMVRQSHKEASRTIAALRPQLRDTSALLEALRQAADRLANDGTLRIETHISGSIAPLPFPVTDAFFRIGQEAISNAVQHSRCTVLTLELVIGKRDASLMVRDNGCGFDPESPHVGLGLSGMRSRAAKVRAHLVIDTLPGRGVSISVRAPLPLAGSLLRTLRYRMKPKAAGNVRTFDQL